MVTHAKQVVIAPFIQFLYNKLSHAILNKTQVQYFKLQINSINYIDLKMTSDKPMTRDNRRMLGTNLNTDFRSVSFKSVILVSWKFLTERSELFYQVQIYRE